MKSKQKNATTKIIKVVVISILFLTVLAAGMFFSGFPLVDKIIGDENETNMDIVVRTVGYDQFMQRASDIVSKVDVTKKIDGEFSCKEENIYEMLFLFNLDFLTEDAIKQLMDENIIKDSALANGESARYASELIGIYEEKREFGGGNDMIYYDDFCLSDVNLNLVKFLKKETKKIKFLREYHDFIVNDGTLSSMPDDKAVHLNSLKLSEYAIGLQYIIWSTYQFTNYQFQIYGPEVRRNADVEKQLNAMDNKMGNESSNLLFLKKSRYDIWFSLGVTQYIDKKFPEKK